MLPVRHLLGGHYSEEEEIVITFWNYCSCAEFLSCTVLEKTIWRHCPEYRCPFRASAEGVGGCPLPSWLEGLCEHCEPPAGSGAEPTRNAFWPISKATERSFLHLYADGLSLLNNASCYLGARPRCGGNCPQPHVELCLISVNALLVKVCWLVCCSEFSTESVHSGSGLTRDLVDIIHDELWSLRLDNVAVESYQVLLSKLDTTKPNFVRVFYADNERQVVGAEGFDISDHRRHYNFAEYSPSGNVTVHVSLCRTVN